MEPLILPGTDDTPEINFDAKKGILRISGKSLPEDVIGFYSPVFSWLERYVSDPHDKTTLEVKVVYFNSASQRALNELLSIISRVNLKGKEAEVIWHYHEDDDEILEAGQEYADITNLPFVFKSFVAN
jgi:hypothetical protein